MQTKEFDSQISQKYLAIETLLSQYQNKILIEHEEYLREHKRINAFRNEFRVSNKHFDTLHAKLAKLIPEHNKENLFKDFTELTKQLDKFFNI